MVRNPQNILYTENTHIRIIQNNDVDQKKLECLHYIHFNTFMYTLIDQNHGHNIKILMLIYNT